MSSATIQPEQLATGKSLANKIKSLLKFVFWGGMAFLFSVYLYERLAPLAAEPMSRELLVVGFWLSFGLFMFGVIGMFLAIGRHRYNVWYESLTAEERAEEEYKRQKDAESRARVRLVYKKAAELKKDIPELMSNLSLIEHRQPVSVQGSKRYRTSKIRFKAIWFNHNEIWYQVDGRHMPHGVSFFDLLVTKKQKIETDLLAGTRYYCRIYQDKHGYVWIIVSLKNSLYGIPKRVSWRDAMLQLPKTNPYTVAIGVNEFGRIETADFRAWPHMVVAGATNQGKSVQLTQWIITLIRRLSPDELQLYLVDLKDGLELEPFAEIPHVIDFVREPDQVEPLLENVYKEYQRRMGMFQGVCRNIHGWNKQRRHGKLPYIILIIDELADVLDKEDNKTLAAANKKLMKRLARKARAAGIHMIVATQVLEAAVLNFGIRGNFPGRCVFSVPGNEESKVALGNTMAKGLEPPGRCVYRKGSQHLILQAPIASEDEIQAAIDNAIAWKESDNREEKRISDEQALFELALENYGGACSKLELWEGSNRLLSQKKIEVLLREWQYSGEGEDQIINLESGRYILTPYIKVHGGTTPRYLMPVNGHYPTLGEAQDFSRMRHRTQNEAAVNFGNLSQNGTREDDTTHDAGGDNFDGDAAYLLTEELDEVLFDFDEEE